MERELVINTPTREQVKQAVKEALVEVRALRESLKRRSPRDTHVNRFVVDPPVDPEMLTTIVRPISKKI